MLSQGISWENQKENVNLFKEHKRNACYVYDYMYVRIRSLRAFGGISREYALYPS